MCGFTRICVHVSVCYVMLCYVVLCVIVRSLCLCGSDLNITLTLTLTLNLTLTLMLTLTLATLTLTTLNPYPNHDYPNRGNPNSNNQNLNLNPTHKGSGDSHRHIPRNNQVTRLAMSVKPSSPINYRSPKTCGFDLSRRHGECGFSPESCKCMTSFWYFYVFEHDFSFHAVDVYYNIILVAMITLVFQGLWACHIHGTQKNDGSTQSTTLK